MLRICRKTPKQFYCPRDVARHRGIEVELCLQIAYWGGLLSGRSQSIRAAAFEGADVVVDLMHTRATCYRTMYASVGLANIIKHFR